MGDASKLLRESSFRDFRRANCSKVLSLDVAARSQIGKSPHGKTSLGVIVGLEPELS